MRKRRSERPHEGAPCTCETSGSSDGRSGLCGGVGDGGAYDDADPRGAGSRASGKRKVVHPRAVSTT
jgi:hypothetical protein